MPIFAIPLTFFDARDLTPEYQEINPSGVPENCFLIKIINDSNVRINISYDGSTDHEIIISGISSELTSFDTNQAVIQSGNSVFIKSITGTGFGKIYLAGFYFSGI